MITNNNNNNNKKITPAHLKNLKITPQDSRNVFQNVIRRIQNPITAITTTPTTRTKLESATTTTAVATTNKSIILAPYDNNDSLARSRLESNTLVIKGKRHKEAGQQEAVNIFNFHCTNNFNVHFKKQQNTSVASLPTPTMAYDKSVTRWSWWLLSLLIRKSSSPSSATAAYITFLILTTTCSLCSASLCESQSWWDPYKDKCIPCTLCQGDMIPLRPCQMHRDTVCGSIYDLKIDWVVLSKTEPNWKERRKFDGLDYGLDHHQLTAEQLQQLQDETDSMDWQTAALFLAVLACLLFFIVAACILVHHMRQWRRMERRLDQDVEELSTKLMAKLAEVQSLEGGTFFIGNADALRIPTTATFTTAAAFHQPQRVLLPEKLDKNQQNLQHDRRLFHTNMTSLKSGNVYIEENSSKC